MCEVHAPVATAESAGDEDTGWGLHVAAYGDRLGRVLDHDVSASHDRYADSNASMSINDRWT